MTLVVRAMLSLLLLAVPVAAQSHGTVTGRITSAAGAPISGASVRVDGSNRQTASDVGGRYRLAAIQVVAGQPLTIQVSAIGYQSGTRTVRLAPGDSATVDFRLPVAAVAIEGLVVTAITGVPIRRAVSASPEIVGPGAGARPHNTEEYRHIQENRFRTVAASPRSTFGIDVDRASYANVRRFLRQGAAPPVDAVRIEEMINYFAYDYPDPTDDHPFAVHSEVGPCPWNTRHRLVRIALQAHRPAVAMPPANLVFLLDVSGSMRPANKLPLVRESLRLLVAQLRAEDRVAIVVYAGAAGLVLDATPGDQQARIMAAIDQLEAGGSTAGAQGIQLAYDIARRNFIPGGNNRVILATDGDFNVGVSSEGELVRLIEREREHGVFLTVLGVGEGNLADARMEALADHGNGNYAYLDGIAEARKVLVEEVTGTLVTVAKDVKMQVEFNPARVAAYRLVGYENRLLADEDFDDDRRDSGDMGAGHSVTALYEVVPVGADPGLASSEPLRYQRTTRQPGARSGEMMFVRLRYKRPAGGRSRVLQHVVREGASDASPSFRWAAAVAEFGMLLRGSEHRGEATVGHVLEQARGALGSDPGGWRAEFIALVEAYRGLALASPSPAR